MMQVGKQRVHGVTSAAVQLSPKRGQKPKTEWVRERKVRGKTKVRKFKFEQRITETFQ